MTMPLLYGEHAARAGDRKGEVLSIQYLRAFAAIVVVIFHLGSIRGFNLSFGDSGVDIFFVISGFIMWMVTRKAEASPAGFIRKRLIRIVPIYWLVTLFLAACAALRPNLFPLDHPEPTHVALSLLFIPHISPTGAISPLVGQGWTLTYEMFFYALFAATLACFRKNQFYALAGAIFACVYAGYLWRPTAPIAATYTSPFLLEFLAGVVICRAWLDNMVLSKGAAWAAIAFGVGAILFAYVLGVTEPRYVVLGAPAALIVFGAVSLEAAGATPKVRTLKFLGDASYSIYLTHYLGWLVVSILATKLGVLSNPLVYPLGVVFAVLAGCAVYYFIEKPMGRLISARF